MARHEDERDPTGLDSMEEYAEMEARVNALIAKIRANKKKLTARGVDVPAEIARLQKVLKGYRDSCVACDKGAENLLNRTANLAEKRIALYKPLRDTLEYMKANDPLNPQIEKLEEVVEALRQELPKDTAE